MTSGITDSSLTYHLQNAKAHGVTKEDIAAIITHQVLNRRWYKSLFRGKYNPYRTLTTAVNILLLLSFAFIGDRAAVMCKRTLREKAGV